MHTQAARYLPGLRRFARLLIGNQQGGDLLVSTALTALAGTPDTISRSMGLHVTLYSTLLNLWEEHQREPIAGHKNNPNTKPISRKQLLWRPAFLLRNIEEMSNDLIQQTLSINADELAELLVLADREIGRLLSTDVMIIEDELLIAFELEDILKRLGHTINTVARTAQQAVRLAKKNPPKLILSDIQLADGSSGIDAVREILGSYPVPVVFITAFPERLLTGMGAEPTYVISKPFRPEQVQAVVSHAVFFDARIRWKLSTKELSTLLAEELVA